MSTITFSTLSGTNNTLPFNPATDILLFDSPSIRAVDVLFSTSTTAGSSFTYNGVSLTLSGTHAFALTPTNVVFADGSKLLIGDQTTGTTTDLATGYTFDGGTGADVFYGFNGVDTFNGGDGDDRIFLTSGASSSADIVNGGNGSDRVIFLGLNTSTGSLQGTTNNTNVNLATSQATWGVSTVQLNSVEEVQVVAANNTSHVLTGSDGSEVFVLGGTSGTATASYTVNGGNGSDWLMFNGFNTTAVSISLANTSTTWGVAQVLYSNVESLSGTAGNDTLTGNSGDNAFYGRGGNDQIAGDSGTDSASFALDHANYVLTKTVSGFTVQANTGNEGTDTLSAIERLSFKNKKIALDLTPDGNAGKSLEFIGMLAFDFISTATVVGNILNIFDQGKSMKEVCQLAIDVGLTAQLAGSSSNLDLARLVYRNVVGSEPSANDAAALASYIQGNGGSMTQAEFLTAVAQLDLNNQHIGLVGLQQTGIEYTA